MGKSLHREAKKEAQKIDNDRRLDCARLETKDRKSGVIKKVMMVRIDQPATK